MPDAVEQRRWTALFSGMVQGVGFRYTAARVARRFAVTGYVRNLQDGRVEMAAEGASGEVSRFLAAVEEAMSGCVRGRQVTEDPATGEFSRFEIRH